MCPVRRISIFSRAATLPVTDPRITTCRARISALTWPSVPTVKQWSSRLMFPSNCPSISRSSPADNCPCATTVRPKKVCWLPDTDGFVDFGVGSLIKVSTSGGAGDASSGRMLGRFRHRPSFFLPPHSRVKRALPLKSSLASPPATLQPLKSYNGSARSSTAHMRGVGRAGQMRGPSQYEWTSS